MIAGSGASLAGVIAGQTVPAALNTATKLGVATEILEALKNPLVIAGIAGIALIVLMRKK
jgi:hypothetical protein